VDDGVDAAQRLSLQVLVAESREVSQGDLHVDTVTSQAARIAHEGPHVVPGAEEQRQERATDGSAGSCQEDHIA
jgi:hypothetical protein